MDELNSENNFETILLYVSETFVENLLPKTLIDEEEMFVFSFIRSSTIIA